MQLMVKIFYLCICACMCVCEYARECMCAILCMHECARVHAWKCACKCGSMCVCVSVCVWMRACECECVRMHANTHASGHVHVCASMWCVRAWLRESSTAWEWEQGLVHASVRAFERKGMRVLGHASVSVCEYDCAWVRGVRMWVSVQHTNNHYLKVWVCMSGKILSPKRLRKVENIPNYNFKFRWIFLVDM